MSTIQSANAASQTQVRAAIGAAAQATGVDFNYLLAQAKLESNLDPAARATTSSAGGLYQFLRGTWLDTLDRHGAEHGLGWAEAAIERRGGRPFIADPALRGAIMDLRNDPQVASLMAAELAQDNATVLQGTLGRAPDAVELYLAHFLGSDGAVRFLSALAASPDADAAALFPAPARANRPIFFAPGGAPRSMTGVMDLLRRKVEGAMEGGGTSVAASGWAQAGGSAPPAAPPPFVPADSAAPGRPSMAEVLRTTFIADGAPAHTGQQRVRAAYDKLRNFGL